MFNDGWICNYRVASWGAGWVFDERPAFDGGTPGLRQFPSPPHVISLHDNRYLSGCGRMALLQSVGIWKLSVVGIGAPAGVRHFFNQLHPTTAD